MADNYYLDVSYINRFVSSFNIQTSNSLACAKQSSSEAAEENPADYFLSPVETMGAYFGRVDENQSNPSVQWSNELNIAWSNQRLAQKKRPRTLSFGVEGSTFREKGNKPAECLFLKNQSPPFSECPPKFPVERIENEGTSLTDYIDWNILHATSSKHVISSIEKTTDNVLPGSSAGADMIHIAGPSEIQTQSHRKGKKKPLKCGVCQKTFNDKGHLNRHKRTHEKPFECNIWWQEVLHAGQADEASPDTQRREAIRMQHLWQQIHPAGLSDIASPDTQWRDALRMQQLQQEIRRQEQSDEASPDTYRREAQQV